MEKGGGSARRLNPRRRYAPFTITDPGVHNSDLGVHDGAIWVFTMAEIRTQRPIRRATEQRWRHLLARIEVEFRSPCWAGAVYSQS